MLFIKTSQLIVFFCVSAVIFLISPVSSDASESRTVCLPALQDTGGQAVEHKTGFYYTIQRGDTLWDISEHFFDSPWLWPDLWSENRHIANPHWIYPGERIRLFHREDVELVRIIEVAEDEVLQVQEIRPPYFFYSPIERIGFIRKEAVSPYGSIFKVRGGGEMICRGDIVYIKQTGETPVVPGKRYTVYRTLDPIKDRETKEYVGIQHYLTGVVEIVKKEPHFAVARVVQSFRSIKTGDLLMPHEERLPEITLTESQKELKGKIILSEERHTIFGDNIVVFINRGDRDGVKPGQLYSIYYQQEKWLDPKTEGAVLLTPVDLGTLLVLHAEQTTSTALITRSNRDIEAGAKISSPFHGILNSN